MMEAVNARTLTEAIEQFIYLENELLDEGRYGEWLDLFASDGLYWVPLQHGQDAPSEGLSLFDENIELLRMRIARMHHPTAHGMEVPIWTSRVIGNLRIRNEAEHITATARFMLTESENDRQRIFAGKYEYRMTPYEDSFRIRRKRVDLVNCDAPFASIQIIL